jgi:hypothetical protein
VKPLKKTVRNFLYKNRRVKVALVEFEGDGCYHVWVGRKLVSCFGFGTVQEAINEGKFEINNSKYRRK